MYTIYVLQDKNGKLYKGMTTDIVRRLKEHQRGKTKTTSQMKNLRLVYSETAKDSSEARKREKYFKSAAGRRFLKTKLDSWTHSSVG